jgi:hypothetical protein
MTTEQENKSTWYDDLMTLIRKKQEENQALKKVQESLESLRSEKNSNDQTFPDADQVEHPTNDNSSNINEHN